MSVSGGRHLSIKSKLECSLIFTVCRTVLDIRFSKVPMLIRIDVERNAVSVRIKKKIREMQGPGTHSFHARDGPLIPHVGRMCVRSG